MKSLLPSQEAVNTAQMMCIYRTRLGLFKHNNVKTNIELVDTQTGRRSYASPNVYRIDDPKVIGYMPSKMWHDDNGFNMLFYTNPAMPDAARPFGTNPCYAFTLYVREGTSVEYDWQTRIFIDQLQTKVGMAYMFLFSEVDAKQIMQTQWDGTPWEIERPHISADIVSFYNGSIAHSVASAGQVAFEKVMQRISETKDPVLDDMFKNDEPDIPDWAAKT